MIFLDGSLVTVNRTRSAVTYQFHEKNLFYTNGYKLLQNSYKSGFVKCNKGMLNGNIRLTYDISSYVTLASVLPELDSKCFLRISNAEIVRNDAIVRLDLSDHEPQKCRLEGGGSSVFIADAETVLISYSNKVQPYSTESLFSDEEERPADDTE